MFATVDGQFRSLVNTVDPKTGESFTVAAQDKYTAAVVGPVRQICAE